MNRKALIGGIAGVVVVAVAVVVVLKLRNGRKPEVKPATMLVELRAKPGDPDSIVDPKAGEEMFKANCMACHGWRGQGDGPADGYLWRKPRNLSDGAYMNSRTDEQLQMVINNGGRVENIFLSRLMPAWNTTFNMYQQQDLIAWVRRLHPTIEEFVNAGDYVKYSSVLSPERAGQVTAKAGSALAPGEHYIAFYAVWSTRTGRARREDKPAPAPGASGLSGYVAFTQLDLEAGVRVSIGMAISPEKRVHKIAMFERVVLLENGKREETAVDQFVRAFEGAGDDIVSKNPPPIPNREALTKQLGDAIKRMYWRLLLGMEQDKEDWEDIAAGKKPNADHPGRAIYERMDCIKCHGPTGRAKGPTISEREPLARDFADGAYMNTLSDQYLIDLLENGGTAMGISSVMPSYSGNMNADEMKALIAYVRTLAVPKK
ncbi:MAG: c-type cytochrome [Planctomycetes bacterium]|nr:c-type cytochrome [Planctomycetota bacterium]